MTPKERAEEIISKYIPLSVLVTPKMARMDWCIKCATIAVDEIIESFPVKTISDCEKHDYWVTVKTEIENL